MQVMDDGDGDPDKDSKKEILLRGCMGEEEEQQSVSKLTQEVLCRLGMSFHCPLAYKVLPWRAIKALLCV
jgi:hypothetical protein